MEVGYELIRQQLFFGRELKERVYWFIRLRWLAAGAGAVSLAGGHLLQLKLPFLPLSLIVLFIAAYNLVFVWAGRRLETSEAPEVRAFQVFAHAQISFDLLALYLLIYFTGGASSPLLIFVIFHVILAGILLSPKSCYAYAVVVLLALGGLILWPKVGLPPIQPPAFLDRGQQTGALIYHLVFGAGILVAAFLTTSIRAALQVKGRELLRISAELDTSNAKLTSLYEMIKEVSLHTKLQELMNSATRNAARIMGVKACSVKILDPEKECLRFAATYGLSEDYLSKDCISLEKSAINRKIIEGSVYAIGQIDEEDYFQYPEEIRKEGIGSMLCLPLKVDQKTLGVFCVYSGQPNRFTAGDADFFSLMTDLTALAMERLGREVAKAWFLNKAAHQMRSPLTAVLSMLHLLTRGYLGPTNEKQLETLTRCEKRLTILGDVITDLLKLAAERRETGLPALRPIDLSLVLDTLAPLFRAQASEKGVGIEFQAPDGLPRVMAQEAMLDELFSNLIANAIKYTPKDGQVRVKISAGRDDTVRFQVSDTGIGIPEGDLSRLFSEFFRAENAKALVEEGTGLGLVIVKEILDRLGGTVKIESMVGQGTIVTCDLPAAVQQGRSG